MLAVAQARAAATSSGWSGTLGAGPVFVPKYVGGKDFQVVPLPIAYVTYDEWFFVNLYRAGAYVWSSEDKKKGVSFSFEPRLGFHASDGAKLTGMATRRGSLSGGPTFDWQGDPGALSIGYFSDLSNASRGGYVDRLVNRPLISVRRLESASMTVIAPLHCQAVV